MINNALKKIVLILSIISLSITLAVIPIVSGIYNANSGLWTSNMHQDKKLLEKDFYKSNIFEFRVVGRISSLINETVKNIDDEVENYIKQNIRIEHEEYTDENGNSQWREKTIEPTKEEAIKSVNLSINNIKDELKNNYSDIKFMAINKKDNIIYSNTKYNTLEEYKKNINEYVDIQLVKTSEGILYTKDIDGKKYINSKKGTYSDTLYNMVSNNIEMYISFPKKAEYTSNLYTELNEYNTSIKYVEVFTAIGSISIIVFLLFTILNKLIKGEAIKKDGLFIKIIKLAPLELWFIFLCFIGIFTIQFLKSHYYGYSYATEKLCGFIGMIVIVTVLYLQLFILNGYHNKVEFFKNTITYKLYKYIKNVVTNILISSKKMPLIKQIILISILISGGSLFIGFIMATILGFGLFGVAIPIFIAMPVFTFYIVKNLAYLSRIMDGAKKIKSGDLNYKIKIEGDNNFTELAQNINNIGQGLEKSIDKQLKSERMRNELITNVSHDLKTPLTSIINYIELIKKEENMQPEYLNDYVKVLDQKSKRLKILIEDLFEASKASSGNIELNISKLDITQLLEQSIGEMEEKLSEANLDIKLNTPNEKVYIYADGRRMYRVFENLLLNISKYSLQNTRVYIDLAQEENNIKLTMKNISSYELNIDSNEIIERFKRGDESRNTEGSGLGLAIAKDLVELQNGKFNIDIDGDLFKVTLEFNNIEN